MTPSISSSDTGGLVVARAATVNPELRANAARPTGGPCGTPRARALKPCRGRDRPTSMYRGPGSFSKCAGRGPGPPHGIDQGPGRPRSAAAATRYPPKARKQSGGTPKMTPPAAIAVATPRLTRLPAALRTARQTTRPRRNSTVTSPPGEAAVQGLSQPVRCRDNRTTGARRVFLDEDISAAHSNSWHVPESGAFVVPPLRRQQTNWPRPAASAICKGGHADCPSSAPS